MKAVLKKVMSILRKKLKSLMMLLFNSVCYGVYYYFPIKDNLVVFDSRDSRDFTGNIFRIAQELSTGKYGKFKMYALVERSGQQSAKALTKTYGINVHFVSRQKAAIAIMEMAKYIVSDSSLPQGYVKREGQVVLNTWHGTPLKKMGKEVFSSRHIIAECQHLFLCSDYLLYPSKYMRDIMLRDYMVKHIYSGKILMSGYPRNGAFFDAAQRTVLRKAFGLENRQVFVYMPTHRGNYLKRKYDEQRNCVERYLREIDSRLNDEQILFVKLHVFNQSKLNFSSFRHIKPFPVGYETYDVLNTADCLITDYSSVFFDFANTGRKIILFAYDKEEYFHDRGTYFSIEELPFPIVKSVDDLIAEMNSPKAYNDTDFIAKYCPNDSLDAAEKVCRHIFMQENTCCEETVGNTKENVLISAGTLKKNGITTSLRNLLNSLDCSEKNYYITFSAWDITDPSLIDAIPPQYDYIPLGHEAFMTVSERIALKYFMRPTNHAKSYPKILKRCFQREMQCCYPDVEFNHIIHFTGYGEQESLLFLEAKCKRTIFVHNNMLNEIKTKRKPSEAVLRKAYSEYDNIAVVSPTLIESTMQLGASLDKIKVVHNIHNAQKICEAANEPICFQLSSECHTYNPCGIQGILAEKGKKFITVGRFSPEKGHKRLLNAFDEFCNDYPDTQLIIIGGYGTLYEATVNWAKQLRHWQNITVIKAIDNPMPILKHCDFFILSSLYEGLGLAWLEADCLGIPSCVTDCYGTREFSTQSSGYVVENSEKGILQGMYDYMNGKISVLKIDYDEYYKQACREFQELF